MASGPRTSWAAVPSSSSTSPSSKVSVTSWPEAERTVAENAASVVLTRTIAVAEAAASPCAAATVPVSWPA
ncbi:hypothetical protein GCM10023169_13370 [Georgenia halophila]|uniref:Uncharacterized protein n=1 Tax=Georgenia halophila TaxID=620889 RepID=A0ABP8L3J9_9MICO